MNKSYFKEIFREISRTRGRFISLVAIVALGSGFFGGIKATSGDMKMTAEQLYSQANLMDFRVVSTLGLTDDDVEALSGLENVAEVMPSYQYDSILEGGRNGDVSVVRLHAYYPDMSVNRPILTEGRYPEKPNECLLISSVSFSEGRHIGEKLLLDLEADPETADNLNIYEYEIVGLADSPLYVSISGESTTKGDSSVSTYAYIPAECFNIEAYTEICLTMEKGDTPWYNEEYDELAATAKAELEDIGPERTSHRYNEIIDEAQQKLDDARAEFEAEKADAEEKLADAEKKLADAEIEIADGERELADGKRELADAKRELDDGLAELAKSQQEYTEQISKAEKELADAKAQLDEAKIQLDAGMAALAEGKQQFSSQKAQADIAIADLQFLLDFLIHSNPTDSQGIAWYEGQIQAIQAQIEAAQSLIAYNESQLNEGYAEYNSGLREYNTQYADYIAERTDAEKKIADGWAEIEDGRKQIADAEIEIADGERKLADGRIELADAEKEFNEKKAEADEQIADAELKLEDAQSEINDIEQPEWYVLDRDTLSGYVSFEQDAERINAVAAVFPILFFLVAALVCLTTMTRMVQDERTQIGVMKALGYSNGKIAAKYLLYAAATCIIGSAIGLTIGFQLFPRVIWTLYGMMYITPPIVTPWDIPLAILSTVLLLVCTVGSTFFACRGEMAEVPASLIRPKPPESGKRILLERVKGLWNHMSFTAKLTARNIFRYKKRFLMTTIGIAGCTALMLTGFGLKDSISGIVSNQFDKLWHYDVQISLAHKIDESNPSIRQNMLISEIENSEYVSEYMLAHQESVKAYYSGESRSIDINLYVPQDINKVDKFFTFQTMKGAHPITLDESGAIVTQKLADELELKIGDTLTFEDSDHKEYQLTVASIAENYVNNYVYVTPSQYEAVFGESCGYQLATVLIDESDSENEAAFVTQILKNSEVIGVFSTATMRETFDNSIGGLDLVVVVLIISACLLASVVLYNLTNINISERKREIATIKVLGFYNIEVDKYIYRENMILTAIGIALGCGLGIYMHKYVMRIAEVNMVMFGRDIMPMSFLWASLITLAFSIIINFAVHFKLKKIDMVESLKSVE